MDQNGPIHFVRRNWKVFISFIVIASVFLSILGGPKALAEESFEGWNEDNKEYAWTIYSATDWDNLVKRLVFSSDGSMAKSAVPEEFRTRLIDANDPYDANKSYETVVEEVLKDRFQSYSLVYPAEEYKELLLSIMYVLNQKGERWFSGNGLEFETKDICFYSTFISPSISITDVRSSIIYLMNRLYMVEQAYRRTFVDLPSIYTKDAILKSVIQGIVFGYLNGTDYDGYAEEQGSYSEDIAKEWYTNNKDKIPDKVSENFSTFADDVLELYTAVQATSSAIET